jgi:diguanylate cyclase (GGDEF)-like protein/PAS domain S-box-containing protein
LVRAVVLSPELYRRQAGTLLIASMVPWIGNVIYVSGLSPVPGLELTPISFAVTGSLLALGIFQFRLFDLVPVARDRLIESMSDGVLVLDAQNRIVDINPAAQRIIGVSAASAIGKPAGMILAAWTDLVARYRDMLEAQTEVSLGGNPPRVLDLRISPLYDRYKHFNGRLIILRDITERKRAEEETRRAKEEWERTFGAIPDLIAILDAEQRIVRCNKSMTENLKLTLQEIEGTKCYQRFHGTEEPPPSCPYLSMVKDGQTHSEEVFVERVCKDFFVTTSPFFDAQGQVSGCVHVAHDITERKRAEEALRESEEKHRQLFDLESDAIFMIDNETGRIIEANAAAAVLYGYSREELLLKKNTDLSAEPDKTRQATMEQALRIPVRWHRKKDGGVFPVEITASHFIWHGHPVHIAAIRDITERERAEEKLRQANERLRTQLTEIESLQVSLREQATRDSLTGLFNRRYLEETLERELARATREGHPVSLVMMDIDHFKGLNDAFGHKAGDLVLEALGKMLRAQTRHGDVACRYGGEEFVIVMPGAPLDVARQRAEQWRKAFNTSRVDYAGQGLQATISVGVAAFPDHGTTSEEMLRVVDDALYAAKSAGRNRVIVWNGDSE